MLQETLMMIPDCHRRIVAAKGELEQLLETEVERPNLNQLISKTVEEYELESCNSHRQT